MSRFGFSDQTAHEHVKEVIDAIESPNKTQLDVAPDLLQDVLHNINRTINFPSYLLGQEACYLARPLCERAVTYLQRGDSVGALHELKRAHAIFLLPRDEVLKLR